MREIWKRQDISKNRLSNPFISAMVREVSKNPKNTLTSKILQKWENRLNGQTSQKYIINEFFMPTPK